MNLEKIAALNLPEVEQQLDARDTILYALGLGYGTDPLDREELPFVYERDLKAVPSICTILCHPGFWARNPEHEIDWAKLLHAEQRLQVHAPLPSTGRFRGVSQIIAIEDKGPSKGAMLHQRKLLFDMATDTQVATSDTILFLRGNGGEGGFGEAPLPLEHLPDHRPDRVVDIATAPNQALIYRLSGDWNPLHADPEFAASAGFERPILHGLCTYGLACRAILAGYCGNQPEQLNSLNVRFTRPVVPGETIRFEFYEGGPQLRFRAVAAERNEVVLDRCSAQFAAAGAIGRPGVCGRDGRRISAGAGRGL